MIQKCTILLGTGFIINLYTIILTFPSTNIRSFVVFKDCLMTLHSVTNVKIKIFGIFLTVTQHISNFFIYILLGQSTYDQMYSCWEHSFVSCHQLCALIFYILNILIYYCMCLLSFLGHRMFSVLVFIVVKSSQVQPGVRCVSGHDKTSSYTLKPTQQHLKPILCNIKNINHMNKNHYKSIISNMFVYPRPRVLPIGIVVVTLLLEHTLLSLS